MDIFCVEGFDDYGSLRRAEDGFFEVYGTPLKRAPLVRLMRLAQRSGALWRCLSMTEYVFVKLVFRVTVGVRSLILARALAPIIKKLLELLRADRGLMIQVLGEVDYWVRAAGRALAEKVARIAQLWGNRSAHKWARDEGFIRYLTIMNIPELKRHAHQTQSV